MGFEPRLISAHFFARWSGWRLRYTRQSVAFRFVDNQFQFKKEKSIVKMYQKSPVRRPNAIFPCTRGFALKFR